MGGDQGRPCGGFELTDKSSGSLFSTPQLHPPQRGDERARRNAIRAWVDSLPLANLGETARLLYERLSYLNAHKLSPADRFAILEAIRPALDLVLQSLGRHYRHQDLPLSGRPALVAKLARELLVMMVIGYQLVLRPLAGTSPWAQVTRSGRRVEALHRRLHYLGRMLLDDFQLYRKHPKGLWREIHATYLEALQGNLQDRPVDSEEVHPPRGSTISNLYKRILLLSLSAPYRMLQGEVQRVDRALHRWAPLSRLQPLEPRLSTSALYLVEPGVDLPPRYRDDLAGGDIHAWALDTNRLSDAIARELEALGTASPADEGHLADPAAPLGAELLGRLALAWGLGGARATARESSDAELDLIYGIGAIIRALDRDPAPQGLGSPPDSEASVGAVYPPETPVGRSVWDLARMPVDEDIAIRDGELSRAPWSRTRPDTMVHRQRSRIIDRSPRGFHLHLSGRGTGPRRVGELVAATDPDAGTKGCAWRVGVIRWMRANSADDVRVGVEILSDHPEPVVLCWQRHEQGDTVSVASLLLGDAGEDESRVVLLTPAFFPAAGDRLKLRHGGRERSLRVLQAIERTRSFVHCRYAPAVVRQASAPPTESEPAPVPASAAPEDEFDTLWRNL